MTIPVLVAWRTDNSHRQYLWDYLQTNYWSLFSDYKIVEGSSMPGPFNRSQALNNAARNAGNWETAVIADADTWVPPHNLKQAIQQSSDTGKLVAAFNTVIELTEDCTDAIINNWSTPMGLDVRNIRTQDKLTQSSMLAVPRQLWDRVGGFDENFIGWGGEDQAFWHACRTVSRDVPKRITGPAFHLWHQPASDRTDVQWRRNLARWQRYARVSNESQLRRIQAIS